MASNDLALHAILQRVGDTNQSVRDLDRKIEAMREGAVNKDAFTMFCNSMTSQFELVRNQFDAANKRFDGIDSEISLLKADDASTKLETQKGKLPSVLVDILKYGIAGVVTTILIYIIHGGKW